MGARIKQIQQAICDEFGITMAQLLSNRKAQPVAHVRSIAMAAARELTGASYPKLARCFNRSDHTTIMNGVRRAPELIAKYPEYAASRERALEKIRADQKPQP